MVIQEPDVRGSLKGVHGFLVDDEVECRAVIKQALEYCGALVTACKSARHALSLMQRVKPNVLVVGIRALDENGCRLMQSVRALPPEDGGAVPAVALTSFGYDVSTEQIRSRGFQVHLDKPVRVSELSASIAAMVKPWSRGGGELRNGC